MSNGMPTSTSQTEQSSPIELMKQSVSVVDSLPNIKLGKTMMRIDSVKIREHGREIKHGMVPVSVAPTFKSPRPTQAEVMMSRFRSKRSSYETPTRP